MAPAQQRLAARHLVAPEIDHRLVVDLEGAIDKRLTQIPLQRKPCLGMCVHCRLEKAIGSAAVGLGAVHRQIGILDQLIEIGAILRRQSNADAGVGHELVAEALIGLTDRLMNARHEFYDVAGIFDIGLDHRELIAAKPGDMVGISDAIPDAPRHGFQQLIADMMSERVVDALELVDIDVKQRELLAAAGSLQFLFDSFARQPELSLGDPIDQHVSAIAHVLYGDLGRNVIDNLPQEAVVAITLLLDMPPLGDVFDRRHPSAMRQGLVDDVKRTSVRGFHDGMGYFSVCDVLQDVRTKFLDITLKRSGFLPVPDDIEEVAARLDDVRRQTAHVDIALVADYHARRLVIQHQTLGHVVEGSVEAMFFRCELLLRLLILPVHLPDDQEKHEGDHQGRQNGGSNHETGLGPPVREYDCYG